MHGDLVDLLAHGPATTTDLMHRLAVSQPTISRLVAAQAQQIAMVGKARATKYGLRRRIRDLPDDIPVYRVSAEGQTREVGTLVTVHGAIGWQDRNPGGSGFSVGLPWFLADMQPQGFLGRSFAQQHPELALRQRLEDWSHDDVLYAVARRGEDMVGNLLVGEESLARWVKNSSDGDTLPMAHRARLYPVLAQAAMGGALPDALAGGAHPKILTAIEAPEGLRHVLVKFSAPMNTPLGQRQADLLSCEAHALQVLREAGGNAAAAEIIDAGNRRFLEVQRYDRVGARGRVGIISLGALADQLVGERRSWHAAGIMLQRLRHISYGDAQQVGWLQAYAAMIGDVEADFANLSFFHEGDQKLRLAPAYDLQPSLYAPQGDKVSTPDFQPPSPPPRALEEAREAQPAAVAFWHKVAKDAAVSDDFRKLASQNAEKVGQMKW